jgi:GNAT superfamily N-acetyltransferase
MVKLERPDDNVAIKALADREKHGLGFVHRGAFVRSAARDELLVADTGAAIAGFCQYYRRRDGIVTVYDIAVAAEARGAGLGRALIDAVNFDASARHARIIRLKCPACLPSNNFYARLGFALVASEASPLRPLNVWELGVLDPPVRTGP